MARHTIEILDNVHRVLAIELLAAAQAIHVLPGGPARLGRGTALAYTETRKRGAFLCRDRETAPDIEALADLIRSGDLVGAVAAGTSWRSPDFDLTTRGVSQYT